MSTPILVLDKGFVRLVDHMGTDLSIVRAARVSYDADWRAGSDESADEKLIRYLMTHEHNTPFEAVVFTFEIKAPIFVFRQWHRHRTQSYNEVSGRYMELTEYHVPEPDTIAEQSKSSKQGRELVPMEDAEAIRKFMDGQHKLAFTSYHALLENGVAREMAREVLPVATYSRMFTTLNLRNLFGFLALRLDSHAQYEIRVYAEALATLIQPIVPIALDAFFGKITLQRDIKEFFDRLIQTMEPGQPFPPPLTQWVEQARSLRKRLPR